MQQVRMLGQSRIEVVEAPDPKPGPGEVLVEIELSALCGSELHGYRGDCAQPGNFGHEAMGLVARPCAGGRLQPGDRVGIHAVWGCGRCAWCARGCYTYCDSRTMTPGTHAALVAAPEHVLLRLDDDIPDAVGVLLSGDGLGVPYHVQSQLQVPPGSVVCVVGVGPIGLGNTLLQAHGGARVIAFDQNDYRLGLARQMGAELTVNVETEDPIAAVADFTKGLMAPYAIECVGKPETLRLCLSLVGKGGAVMAVGEQGPMPVDVSADLIRRDITLRGNWFFHYGEFPAMVDLYRNGLAVEQLVTHRFILEHAAEAFTEFAAGRTGKALIMP